MTAMPHLEWHLPLLQHCARLMERRRLPHAILIRGRPGDGLIEAARALAALRLCDSPVDGRACGNCKACLLLAGSSHPDLLTLEPESGKKVIPIDAVRGLVQTFSHTPQVGAWKTAIIQPATSLQPAAANALLKTLEEPAGQSLLILTAERHAQLLPTIQSRCQVLKLPAPTPAQAQSWLAEQGVDGEAAADLLTATANAPLAAWQWHEEGKLAQWREFRTTMQRLAAGETGSQTAAGELKGVEAENLVDWYQQLLGESMKAQLGEGPKLQALMNCYDQALEASRELDRGTNPNAQLLAENLLMQWQSAVRAG